MRRLSLSPVAARQTPDLYSFCLNGSPRDCSKHGECDKKSHTCLCATDWLGTADCSERENATFIVHRVRRCSAVPRGVAARRHASDVGWLAVQGHVSAHSLHAFDRVVMVLSQSERWLVFVSVLLPLGRIAARDMTYLRVKVPDRVRERRLELVVLVRPWDLLF